MEAFDFVAPSSIDEAVSILNEHGDRARIIAGGTDILVMMRAGRRLADVVVDVKNISELNPADHYQWRRPYSRGRCSLL